jgi:AraC-like DNA-binding protein
VINTYDFQVEHPEMFSHLAVRDLLFLHYKCPQEEKMVKLYTHFNKIIFVLEGKKMIHHSGKSWMLSTENAVFFRKTAYAQERFQDIEWEVLCFYCPDNYLRKVFLEYRQYLPLKNIPAPPNDMLFEINVNAITRAFFFSIVPYFKEQPKPSENLLELKFKELLFSILSNPSNTKLLAYVNSITGSIKPALCEIMEANFTFNLSLTEFSRISQRSLASFKREFIIVYKTTPGKWLTQKRLDFAKQLLDTSSKNVNEIAYDSGFESSTHFSRVFKEKFGLAPLQYRKQSMAVSH